MAKELRLASIRSIVSRAQFLCVSPGWLPQLVVSVLFGTLIVFLRSSVIVPIADDFLWARRTAQALLVGTDPYDFVPSPRRVPYPLTVALFGFPALALPSDLSTDVFLGLSSALLLWAFLRHQHYARVLLFASFPYVDAFLCGQWTPLITATWYLPLFAPLLSLIKPQIAAAVALARWRWCGVGLAAVVLGASLVAMPDWPSRWLAMVGDYQATYPIAGPLGFVLLLSLGLLRDARGRLLFLASVLPYRGGYDWLQLGVVPTTGRQILLFVMLSWLFPLLYLATGYEVWLTGVHLFCLACLVHSQGSTWFGGR